MKNTNWKSFLLCVLLVTAFTAAVVGVHYYQKYVQLGWRVVESEGIEVFPDALMFGDIEQGRNATSSFTVTNVADVALNVTISHVITLCGWGITTTPNNFILEVGEPQTVTVTIWTSELTQPGNYAHDLEVTAKTI